LQEKKSKKEILDLLEKINKGLPGIMELDLEDFYSRAIFVSRRGGGEGAKKKYALIRNDGSVKIRGFETVRRDWCKLARNLQSEILKSILKSGNEKEALKTLKVVVKKLKSGDVPLEDLIIKTQLKKQMDSYLAKGPHVVAAKRMQKNGVKVYAGMMIRYFIGEVHGKTKRIGDKVFLPEEKVKYDSEYYLNNQVLPAVGNIFEVFGIDVIEVIDGERQNKLF
jgi:DNA polymerase I